MLEQGRTLVVSSRQLLGIHMWYTRASSLVFSLSVRFRQLLGIHLWFTRVNHYCNLDVCSRQLLGIHLWYTQAISLVYSILFRSRQLLCIYLWYTRARSLATRNFCGSLQPHTWYPSLVCSSPIQLALAGESTMWEDSPDVDTQSRGQHTSDIQPLQKLHVLCGHG